MLKLRPVLIALGLVVVSATSACTTDADRAFDLCFERAMKEMGDEVDPEAPEEVAERQLLGIQAIAEKSCEAARTTCETDPDGEACRNLLEMDR